MLLMWATSIQCSLPCMCDPQESTPHCDALQKTSDSLEFPDGRSRLGSVSAEAHALYGLWNILIPTSGRMIDANAVPTCSESVES